MTHRDLIVIGGGPAGAATAIRAARHGIAVTVFEKGDHGNLIRYDRAHPGGEVIQSKHPGRGAPSFGYELHDFSLAVLEGKTLAAGPEYSLGELRTALAIYRSAETRQWEKVWD